MARFRLKCGLKRAIKRIQPWIKKNHKSKLTSQPQLMEKDTAETTSPRVNVQFICSVCDEAKARNDTIVLSSCKHRYCKDCLNQVFHLATTDENMYPPRCCDTVPFEEVCDHLDLSLRHTFGKRKLEYAAEKRIYCHLPTCRTFLQPRHIYNDVANCPNCTARTCTFCKAAAHDTHDCPADEELNALLDLAKRNGWKRCSRCRSFVERSDGCNRIRCRCGLELCYSCGGDWAPGKCGYGGCIVHRGVDQMAY